MHRFPIRCAVHCPQHLSNPQSIKGKRWRSLHTSTSKVIPSSVWNAVYLPSAFPVTASLKQTKPSLILLRMGLLKLCKVPCSSFAKLPFFSRDAARGILPVVGGIVLLSARKRAICHRKRRKTGMPWDDSAAPGLILRSR